MKTLLRIVLLLAALTPAFGQGLEKGNLISLHVVTAKLNPSVTLDDFARAYLRDVLPEYEKNWPGLRGYMLRPFFRDAKNQFAIVWLFATVEDRNRNFDAQDRANDLERAALAKVKPFEDRFKAQYGDYTVTYTHDDDWVVQ
jgi:hypothetical protein